MPAATSFDFALLDINLNGKQSFPVADVIRARGLPFLFATGYGSRILGAPYTDTPILQKPFSLEELRRALERIRLLGHALPDRAHPARSCIMSAAGELAVRKSMKRQAAGGTIVPLGSDAQ